LFNGEQQITLDAVSLWPIVIVKLGQIRHVDHQRTVLPASTPALLAPRGCGKTTLLVLLELLVAEPYRTDNVTAAAVYYLLDRRPRSSLLIDEGDNLGLLRSGVLRSVFNSGHRNGGTISRFVGGWSRKFPTFSPLAVAAIGALPLPLLHRAVVISMRRYAPNESQFRIHRLDEADPALPAAREEIRKWAATCSLASDPEMPPMLRNRAADNWRVLLAIADNLGHGEAARCAATKLSSNRLDEDPGVVLLAIFETYSRRGEWTASPAQPSLRLCSRSMIASGMSGVVRMMIARHAN